MANKIYILTIEYSGDDEQVEYIQEEIIDPSEIDESRVIGNLIEQDYWDEDSLKIMKKFYPGEIGES